MTITNGGVANLDLILSTVDMRAGGNGATAESVFDSANGITGMQLTGALAPGQSATGNSRSL